MHQGLLPDVISYFALVNGCGKGTLPQRALPLLDAMVTTSPAPDLVPSIIMRVRRDSVQSSAAPNVRSAARDLVPNMITYSAVLSAGENDLSAGEKGQRPEQHRA